MDTREDDLPVPSVAIADTEYEHFGWWTMVDEDGDVAFQTFFGGTEDAIFDADTGLLVGTATYNGPAAGRYAVKTFNSNSTLDGCESRMAVMSAAWFVEFRQRLPWLLHVD